mmetsp:Transcript_339/g.1140  ORF Transcript_339/g.1140 Transcript_339/m.1140 type:complete len:109 (-) Transcript_339:396-722(-)
MDGRRPAVQRSGQTREKMDKKKTPGNQQYSELHIFFPEGSELEEHWQNLYHRRRGKTVSNYSSNLKIMDWACSKERLPCCGNPPLVSPVTHAVIQILNVFRACSMDTA